MGYVTYAYYKSIYGKDSMSETDFNRMQWEACRRVDTLTLNKLKFAYPTDPDATEAVKRCVCKLIEIAYQIEAASKRVSEGQGYVTDESGALRGKVVSSVSSGSESISYTAKAESGSALIDAVLSDKTAQEKLYRDTVREYLSLVPDSNGVNLLYAGIPYPVRNAPISRPPEDKPIEKPETPPEENAPDNQIESKTTKEASDNIEDTKANAIVGVGYEDSVVVYNHYEARTDNKDYYFGTRLDNVRIEFTQEENQNKAGKENTSVCLLKIHNDSTLPKPYKDPVSWKSQTTEEMLETFTLNVDGDFFVIVKRKGLNLDIDAPVGEQNSDDPPYNGNFFEYMKKKYGFVYSMNSFEQKELIPYFQVGGL